MPELDRLAAAARGLLPPGVAVAATDPRGDAPSWPGEVLAGAVPARRREFAAGRAAARAALVQLGLPAVAIPMQPDRAPLWPEGVTGSITHSATACLAAVTRRGALRGLGLDLEPDKPLAADLWETICLPAERDWLEGQPEGQRGRLALLIFSAKEAAYKAQYAVSRQLFGFDTLRIHIAPETHGFTATFQRGIGPFERGARLQGRYGVTRGHILTVAAC